MKIYICGPITGIENKNRPAFDAAARLLRGNGHEVTHVLEIEDTAEWADRTWQEYMRRDLRYLADVDGLFVLPGWERSRGATLEVYIATQIGLQVEFAPQLPEYLPLANI